MVITDSAWELIATDSAALVQKTGAGFISLAYHTTTPTTQDTFGLTGNEPLLLPNVVGKNIYAKSTKGDINLSVEAA